MTCRLVHSWHMDLHVSGGAKWALGTQLALDGHAAAALGGHGVESGGRDMAKWLEAHRSASLVRCSGGLHGAGEVARRLVCARGWQACRVGTLVAVQRAAGGLVVVVAAWWCHLPF